MGAAAWLDQQLAPDLDTASVDAVIHAAFPPLVMGARDLADQIRADNIGPLVTGALGVAQFARHVGSPFQLYERMVEFWNDHLNTPITKQAAVAITVVDDREVTRPYALGRFDDLLVASAQSPAMLLYLDNATSTGGAINENYGRELLELHTLGADGGYTEDDVVSVARLLTGWGIERDTLTFRFFPARHDPGSVEMLGWTRPTTGDPQGHGESFLRHLAVHPATARHISRKLAVRFVADDPPADIVDAMADTWTANDSAIVPVLRTMFDHPSFATAPPKFQRPWEFLVQSARALDVPMDAVSDRAVARQIAVAVRDLGQVPFAWPAPNGYPDVEGAWHDAGSVLTRWRITADLVGFVLGPDSSAGTGPSAAGTFDRTFADLTAPAASYR